MDNYLESLVKKRGEPTIEPEEVTVTPAGTTVKLEATEPDAELQDTLNVENNADAAQTDDTELVLEEPKSSESADQIAGPVDPIPTTTIVSGKDIRIFNKPDLKTPFKIFSGNVIVKGKVGDMLLIEYVKPGVGLVKGFTPLVISACE